MVPELNRAEACGTGKPRRFPQRSGLLVQGLYHSKRLVGLRESHRSKASTFPIGQLTLRKRQRVRYRMRRMAWQTTRSIIERRCALPTHLYPRLSPAAHVACEFPCGMAIVATKRARALGPRTSFDKSMDQIYGNQAKLQRPGGRCRNG